MASFSMATNRTWKDKSGQKQEQAEFHNIVAWGKQAEICSQWLKKGSPVLVEGRLQTRAWEGKEGGKRYTTEIVMEDMQFGPKTVRQESEPTQSQIPADMPSGEEVSSDDMPF